MKKVKLYKFAKKCDLVENINNHMKICLRKSFKT
jgi:hypothetical protein